VLSTGAGSEMRRAIGVAVFFGMLGVTAFGLVLTPVFYVLVQRLVEGSENKKLTASADLSSATSVEA
jgi:Cu/Ag efflux pump CusA